MKLINIYKTNLQLAALIGLAIVGLAVLNWLLILPHTALETPDYGNDFGYFWSASRTVWQGGDPYLSEQGSVYHGVRMAAGGNPIMVDPYKSPYYLTLLMMPLAIFPLPIAAVVWLAISQVMMVATGLMIMRLVGQPITPTALVITLGLSLVWRYTLLTLIVGQLSMALLFLIVASYYCSRTGHPVWAGGLAALLLIKPQIVFLVIPLLLLAPTGATRQNWRRLASFGLVSLGLALYSFALSPGWLGQWLKTVFGTPDSYFDNRQVDMQLSSLRSLVALLSPAQNLVLPGLLLLALPLWIGLGWLWWRNRYDPQGFVFVLAVAVAINLMTTPYVRDYDSFLLLFGLLLGFWVWRRSEGGERASHLVWLLALLPIPVHQVMSGIGNAAVELLIPGLVLALLGLTWPRRSRVVVAERSLA